MHDPRTNYIAQECNRPSNEPLGNARAYSILIERRQGMHSPSQSCRGSLCSDWVRLLRVIHTMCAVSPTHSATSRRQSTSYSNEYCVLITSAQSEIINVGVMPSHRLLRFKVNHTMQFTRFIDDLQRRYGGFVNTHHMPIMKIQLTTSANLERSIEVIEIILLQKSAQSFLEGPLIVSCVIISIYVEESTYWCDSVNSVAIELDKCMTALIAVILSQIDIELA